MVKGSGATETAINCSNASGLAFVNMTNLTISDLTLFNCSQSRPSTSIGNVSELYTVPFLVGLYIWRCRDVVIENVHINETNGVGLVLYETGGRVSINSAVFHHNGIPENATGTLQYGGGGVNVEFPYCPPGHYEDEECGKEHSDAEYMFINCNFTNNTASLTSRYSKQFIVQGHSSHQSFGRGGGMAIYFSGNSSNNSVSLSNCHFTGNTAVFGGGLLGEFNDEAQNNNLLLLKCHFIENTCLYSTQENGGGGGGAHLGFLLHEANSVVHNEIHIEAALFERNKAYLGGGLSFVTGYELGVLEPTNKLAMAGCVFLYNIARLGSAVNLMPWTSSSTGLVAKVEIQDNIFSYNSVLYNNSSWYLMGFGTVYTYKVPFDINGRVVTSFYSNKGSGIVVVGTGVNIHSSLVEFSGNIATNGGAIAAYASGWITLWSGTRLHFIANIAQSRGGAIYSESTGGHQIVEPRDCVIRYFEWWRRYEEWNTHLYFDRNLAHESGNDIFVSSLFPCLRSGSSGSADTSIEARRKVFRARSVFVYFGNFTNKSIVTSAAQFNHDSKDGLAISVYPGEVFNFTTLIKPLDELGELSNVPFFVTTHISNNSLPTVLVDPNSVYTAGYLQFQASDDVEKGHGNITTAVELQTVSEPALLLSFNVTLLECPPGSKVTFPNGGTSGECACSRNGEAGYLTGIQCYEHSSVLSIYRQESMWYGKVPSKTSNISVTAPCPQYCDNSNSVNNLVPLNPEDPTSGICRGQSYGILCGTCKHGVRITSHTFECCTLEDTQAISAPTAWVSWFAIQIVLTTIIVLIIFVSDFDVIGGNLGSFIFFSQIVLDLNLQDCTSGTSHQIIVNILRPYAVWSLRFRWLLPFHFCISTFTNTLEALSLDYLFALYPFGLIIFVWAVGKSLDSGKNYNHICSKLKDFFEWLVNRNAFTHGIAACLILTYGDLVSISFFLLTPTVLNMPYNTSDPNDIPGGPWHSLYNGNYAYFQGPHLGYGIAAIIVVVVFGLFPLFLLISYPCLGHLLRVCSDKCSAKNDKEDNMSNRMVNSRVVGWFFEAVPHLRLHFHGHFKGHCRFFAGVWLLYRLGLHANDAFTSDCSTSFAIQIVLGTFFLLFHILLQPNEKARYNILDSLFFANIVLLSTLGLVSRASDGQGSDTIVAVFMVILLIPPLLYFFFIGILYRIINGIYRFRQRRGGQNPDVPTLYDVVIDKLKEKYGGCWQSAKIFFGAGGNNCDDADVCQQREYRRVNNGYESINSPEVVYVATANSVSIVDSHERVSVNEVTIK